HYIAAAQSLLRVQHVEVQVVAPAERDGETGGRGDGGTAYQSNLAGLSAAAGEDVAAIVLGYPNFYGAVQDIRSAADAAHKAGALLVAVSNPLAFGLLESAGNLGADVVCGEAQALGVPLQYGGPYLGYITCKKDFVRRMPGRLVGQSVDGQGRRAF